MAGSPKTESLMAVIFTIGSLCRLLAILKSYIFLRYEAVFFLRPFSNRLRLIE